MDCDVNVCDGGLYKDCMMVRYEGKTDLKTSNIFWN